MYYLFFCVLFLTHFLNFLFLTYITLLYPTVTGSKSSLTWTQSSGAFIAVQAFISLIIVWFSAVVPLFCMILYYCTIALRFHLPALLLRTKIPCSCATSSHDRVLFLLRLCLFYTRAGQYHLSEFLATAQTQPIWWPKTQFKGRFHLSFWNDFVLQRPFYCLPLRSDSAQFSFSKRCILMREREKNGNPALVVWRS